MVGSLSAFRWVFLLRGITAVSLGLMALFYPGLTITPLVYALGLYILVEGLLSIFAALVTLAGQWAFLIEGIVALVLTFFVLLGSTIGSMLWPGVTAVMVVFYVGAWGLVTGISKVIASARLRTKIKGVGVLGLSGGVSILFGLIFFLRSEAGIMAMTWLVGVYAMILGILLILVGIKTRSTTGALKSQALA